jgi:tRNA-specific 2-thiouridylase
LRIGIAISGGVYSSLTAVMMKKVGYDIVGISANSNLSDSEYFSKNYKNILYFNKDIITAKRIAKKYNFPHKTFSLSPDFYKEITENRKNHKDSIKLLNSKYAYLIMKYLADYARTKGCQRLATGYYVRINRDNSGKYYIMGGLDHSDQLDLFTYFTQDLLKFLYFPLGEYHRGAIEKFLIENNLSKQ